MTDPKGNETYKLFDKNKRLIEVIDTSKNDIKIKDKTVYEYELNGNKKSVTYNSGVKESYTYTADNKMKTLDVSINAWTRKVRYNKYI